jgi:hypothetical protein
MSIEEQPYNTLLYEITQEIKAKKRIAFNVFFYFNFYFFSCLYLSSHYKLPVFPKLSLLAFITYPNYIFYKYKFTTINSRIQEVLLIHSLTKLSIIKDQIILDNFVKEYLNYYCYKKLI